VLIRKELFIGTVEINSRLNLVDLCFPVPGYEKFIGAYVYCGLHKAVIDVGPRKTLPQLIHALAQLQIHPEEIDYIILTHIHIDHAGGTGDALQMMPKAKVVVHPRGIRHLVNPQTLWESSRKTLGQLALEYGEIPPVPEERIIVAHDGMKLDMGGGHEFTIYFTPGHAIHHLSVYDETDRILLAGEAAGVCLEGTVRLATPPPFRLAESLASLDKLIALCPDRLCYGHFGCYGDAMTKLKLIREKTISWYGIVHGLARKTGELADILASLREKDYDLNYLNGLPEAAFLREQGFLFNTIQGLLSDKPAQG
jgi:glyoxylase-like metal-dependent hydrolase (beta-lactamase superfamily II)